MRCEGPHYPERSGGGGHHVLSVVQMFGTALHCPVRLLQGARHPSAERWRWRPGGAFDGRDICMYHCVRADECPPCRDLRLAGPPCTIHHLQAVCLRLTCHPLWRTAFMLSPPCPLATAPCRCPSCTTAYSALTVWHLCRPRHPPRSPRRHPPAPPAAQPPSPWVAAATATLLLPLLLPPPSTPVPAWSWRSVCRPGSPNCSWSRGEGRYGARLNKNDGFIWH